MIPVTVVGGYLGAGKTTLVNHLLRRAGGARLAVLVNDFGELAIDADLVEARDEGVIAIAGGCVCCSFGSDLVAALGTLAARTPAPDHVLVETSGVALPGVVARSVALLPGFARDGVVVLADAETVMERAADPYMGDTIARQLTDADLVIVNKTDLLSPDRLEPLRGWLATRAPRARLIDAVRGAVPPEVALGPSPRADHADRVEARTSEDASARYETRQFQVAGPVDARALARALAHRGTGVLRAKGFVIDRDGVPASLQTVGDRFEVAPAPVGARHGAIVCIGLTGALDAAAIEAALVEGQGTGVSGSPSRVAAARTLASFEQSGHD